LADRALAGRGIVVTRPRAQASALAQSIAAHGGAALLYPTVEIEASTDLLAGQQIIDGLAQASLAIFVSPTAVQEGLRLVRQRVAWPAHLRVAAVGGATRRELERNGYTQVIAPETGADSEALLALPQLAHVSGQRIVVFRGEGGRQLLGDTLAARGASVTYAQCYRRIRPATDFGPLLQAWHSVHAVTAYSAQAVRNLFDLLGERGESHLRETPLFVSHARIAGQAARLGAGRIEIAGPGDDEMLSGLVAYFRNAK
jgi:uroporphyrinogen-III synthase